MTRNSSKVEKIMWIVIATEMTNQTATNLSPSITANLTFALSVEGGVAATNAAIVVVSSASLVNAAFCKGRYRQTKPLDESLQAVTCHIQANLTHVTPCNKIDAYQSGLHSAKCHQTFFVPHHLYSQL